MKRRFLLSLASGLWILTFTSAHALIDTNTNGLSDLWEKAFNSNALFSASNPAHAPTADPDGDGWTNHQESTAGTNPFSSAAPHGILTPAIGYTPAIREPAPPGAEIGQPGVVTPPLGTTDPSAGGTGGSPTYTEPLEIRRPARFTLTWQPVRGKAYRIEQSSDLAAWQPTTGFYMGAADPITYQGEAILSDNTEPPKLFYRLKIEDADNDSDGLTDYEETLLGTDPYSADTDRDGIPDNFDPQPLINALQATWDADAIDPSGATLFAAFNFTPPTSGGYPFTSERVTDISGNARNGKARTQSGGLPAQQSPPQDNAEGIANQGFHCANTHHFAFEQKNPGINFAPVSSLSFWLKTKTSDLTGNGQPIFSYAPRTAVFAQSGNTSNPYAARAFIRKQATGTAYEVVWLDWTYPGNIVRERWTLDLTEFQINQRWINLTFVWQGTGSGQGALWACYANGIKQNRTLGSTYRFQTTPTTANTPQDTFVIGADAAGGSGQNNLATIQSTFKGSMDRIRLHSTALSIAQVQAINAQDTDSDGLWDSTEASATTWRDANANSKRDPGEIRYPNGSPIFWQPGTNDADGDGLTDLVEQSIGTRIERTDTDGDRLPDGWEVRFTLNPLDANGANGRDGDPDGDGLLNIDEYRYASKPKPLPGDPAPGQPGSARDSDGDGTGDNTEYTGGSHPGNAGDGGQPLAASEKISVFLAIGDQSDSTSEDYSLEVSVIDPETGEEKHFHTLHADGFGQYKSETIDKFQKGQTYTFRILWNGTNRTDSQGPDFDYTCKIEPQGTGSGFLIDSYDVSNSTANLAAKLTGNNLNDVATDEEDFRAKYRHRRAVLMGVSTVSADRMFGASMQVLPGLENIQLEIKNTTTNEDFGTHSQIFANAYESYEAILGHGDDFGKNVSEPRVWFIQTLSGAYPGIQAYLCSDPANQPGDISIKASFQGQQLGTVKHTLTPDEKMADFIGRGVLLGMGSGLGFPVQAAHSANGAPVTGKAHHWSAALAAPVLMAGKVFEGETAVFVGIFDGVVGGLTDDWKMVVAVHAGFVKEGDWITARAEAYLTAWRTDPITRLREVKDALTRFVKNQVCDKLVAQLPELISVQGFIDTVWGLTPPGMVANAPARFEALIGADPWEVLSEAIGEWFDDFGTRMLSGAEKAEWVAEPFPKNALITGTLQTVREIRYTTGYVFGYLGEQATVGVVSGKAITMSWSLTLKGAKLATASATRLATRTTVTIAAKGAILKKAVAPAAISVAMRVSLEEGFVLAARTPTPGVTGGKNILSVIEESYRALPAPNTTATINKLVDDIVAQPRLAALGQQSWGCLEILSGTARLQNRLAADATEKAIRNWPKFANAITPNAESGLANDFLRYADFETAMKLTTPEGRIATRELLESFDGKTTQQVLEGDIFMPPSIKNLFPKMYHYADKDTMVGFADDATEIAGGVSGKWRLRANLEGRYVTPELIETQALAKSRLQAPLNGALQEVPTKARFRFEYTTSDVTGEYRIPRANVHSGVDNAGAKVWREIIVKDNPARGAGGAVQFVEKEAREGTWFDTVTQQYVRDKAHLNQILSTNP